MKFGYITDSNKYNLKPCTELTKEDIGKDLIIFRKDGVMFYGKLRVYEHHSSLYKVTNFIDRTWSIDETDKFDYDINKIGEQIQKAYERI